MTIDKDELLLADAFIAEHFSRIISWAVGDVKKCCRMSQDGTCDNGGALVGAFILLCCALDYFGGLYTGLTKASETKNRYNSFIRKYMSRYDWEKLYDLRWSLLHYYSPHHFVLYHENSLETNKNLHLSNSEKGILLHLGWFIKDFEDAVNKYWEELKMDPELKIKAWRYYKQQLPIMPLKVEQVFSQSAMSAMATITSIQSFPASGTAAPEYWIKK